ncbi:MAG: MltA domain-containing protein [Magnetococcales bacterium]|nr:MltA domain-containing protein [Magnetococcales bacterium]
MNLFSGLRPRSLFHRLFFVTLLALLAGCESTPSLSPMTASLSPENVLVQSSWREIDQALEEESSLDRWADALEGSVAYFAKKNPQSTFRFGSETVTALEMTRATQKLAKIARLGNGKNFQAYLKKHFRLFRSVGSDQKGDVLVTAYYEPLLYGSYTQSSRYQYPLYRLPDDLLKIDLSPWLPEMAKKKIIGRFDGKKLTPYYNRQEIDFEHKLANKKLELVWVDNLADVFFLQIQGSGRIQLDTGKVLRVGYHGANGHPYRSIGKILIDEGAIEREQMSLPALRKWLRENPSQQKRLFNANPSYVFFRTLDGGPYGNIQVALTPGRSIATDHRLFPKGAAGLLKTTLPRFSADGQHIVDWQESFRFVVNQDTGGAIRGAGRVDLFLGFGQEAEQRAGVMKQSDSRLYFLAPVSNSD